MVGCCHDDHCVSGRTALNGPAWRRALWIALAVNAAMFLAEIAAGLAAGSASLQADALDFLGDAANYAISLGVAGLALAWRARAALLKGATLLVLDLWVLGCTAWHAIAGTLPSAPVMAGVAVAALMANGAVALLLYRFRTGDANMHSVWICSRNDAIGNAASCSQRPGSSAREPAGRTSSSRPSWRHSESAAAGRFAGKRSQSFGVRIGCRSPPNRAISDQRLLERPLMAAVAG